MQCSYFLCRVWVVFLLRLPLSSVVAKVAIPFLPSADECGQAWTSDEILPPRWNQNSSDFRLIRLDYI